MEPPQELGAESMLHLHNGRDREGCEEDLCVLGTVNQGAPSAHIRSGTRAQHIQVWPSHAVLGSSIFRLTMSFIILIKSSSSTPTSAAAEISWALYCFLSDILYVTYYLLTQC